MNCILSPEAEQDLDEIFSFIALDSKNRALEYVNNLEKDCLIVGQNPNIGKDYFQLIPGLKFFPTGNYLIFYRVKTERVEISRILHGSREITPKLF